MDRAGWEGDGMEWRLMSGFSVVEGCCELTVGGSESRLIGV